MSRIPCDVIRDLFPSYIDGLTSEASNKEIREHLQECEECRKILASMKGEEEAFVPEEPEKKEIDYLKKNKKRNLMIVLFSVLGAVLLALGLIGLRLFVIGEKGDNGIYWDILSVEGHELSLKGEAAVESAMAVSGVRFSEKDGIVTVTARKVLVSPFHKGGYEGTYTASENIREVRAGNRVIWSEGRNISSMTGQLFNACHAYVGSMPDNARTAKALHLADVFGSYENALETKEEPYGWKILLLNDISVINDPRNEDWMGQASMLMIASVGNLDRVTFSYTREGIQKEFVLTREEADSFFGQPVRDCMDSPRLLQELMQKTGWDDTVLKCFASDYLMPYRQTPGLDP
ncbi:MAG: DUF4825 domain-containing protein [Lachnospiraceae bacterium]|nr:DUF4825 domain-containing protein [Lachnospiraceae bacterium]